MERPSPPTSESSRQEITLWQVRRLMLQQARMWQQFGVTAIASVPSPGSSAGELPAVSMVAESTAHPIVRPLVPPTEEAAMPRKAPPPPATRPSKSASPPRPTGPSPAAPAAPVPLRQGPPPSLKARVKSLQVLQAEVQQCTTCHELATTRTQTVFGVGNPQPRLCFFGEAPGADEDKQGEPFVGRAGQLLNKIIEACGMSREDVYILNVLKCRPPGNRNPAPDEAAACRHFFERQLEILQPEFICCLGSVAATTLLQTTQSIGQLRGSFHDWRGVKVIATYHPAYLLRNPAAKRDVWEDMKRLLAEMGLPVPAGGST